MTYFDPRNFDDSYSSGRSLHLQVLYCRSIARRDGTERTMAGHACSTAELEKMARTVETRVADTSHYGRTDVASDVCDKPISDEMHSGNEHRVVHW